MLANANIDSFDALLATVQQCKLSNTQRVARTRKSNPFQPWISAELLNIIDARGRYFKLLKKSPSNQYLISKYNDICAELKHKRHITRSNYNSNIINASLHNPKDMWKNINMIIYNKPNTMASISALANDNGDMIINRVSIANSFNIFFRDIGKCLHDNIPTNNTPCITELPNYNPSTMFLFDTTTPEVCAKIMSLKNSATINEGISANLCKQNANTLSPILSNLINTCFANGSFPQNLKISRIIPIYKDGYPLLATNYRPISILPVFSKIFESICCNRINNFIHRHNIIHDNQFGFQKNSGTLSAATSLIDSLQINLDSTKNGTAYAVFIDLRKAFDTVPHELLLRKLDRYGIRGNANSLINDYLSNRCQYVDLNDVRSDNLINNNKFGLPQGSNLGPLLFILYINDSFKLKLNGTLTLFADDAVYRRLYYNGLQFNINGNQSTG